MGLFSKQLNDLLLCLSLYGRAPRLCSLYFIHQSSDIFLFETVHELQ